MPMEINEEGKKQNMLKHESMRAKIISAEHQRSRTFGGTQQIKLNDDLQHIQKNLAPKESNKLNHHTSRSSIHAMTSTSPQKAAVSARPIANEKHKIGSTVFHSRKRTSNVPSVNTKAVFSTNMTSGRQKSFNNQAPQAILSSDDDLHHRDTLSTIKAFTSAIDK